MACIWIIAVCGSKASSQVVSSDRPAPSVAEICAIIGKEAERNGLPKDFFARLIWKESRFDHLALSPVGAMGIAQFMPGTAKERGLEDPNDYQQALPASAKLLSDLRSEFGNLGLAAAAYNAGSGRVGAWLSGKSYLPFETEDYVLDITGEAADQFTNRKYEIKHRPIDASHDFDRACLELPVILSRTTPMARIVQKPWGIQIAGNFNKNVATRSLDRLRKKIPSLRKYRAYVQRRKTPIARKSIYAVRIGADSRGEADRICADLKKAGGACVVTRN